MKIVINRRFGGFGLSDEALKALGVAYDYEVSRTNPKLIEMIEKNSDAVSGSFAKLAVVNIPDNATDWKMEDYDGVESIIAVVDGKLVYI